MSKCEYYEQMNNNLKELDEGVSFENVPSNRIPTKKSLEILYERTNIKDGLLIPYIKADIYGNKQIYIMNKAGEIISIGTVEDLEKAGVDR